MDFKNYIGVKKIKGFPMNRLDYNVYRGWELPADENGDDEGFLVEYVDGGKSNHPDHEGYISWSPKEVFDNAYRPTVGMSFGMALEAMQKRLRLTRSTWKDKFIYYNTPEQIPNYSLWPFLSECTNAEDITPWVPTQEDMFADNWMVAPSSKED